MKQEDFFIAFAATVWIIILIAPIALWVVVRTKTSSFYVKDNTEEEQEHNDWGFIDYLKKMIKSSLSMRKCLKWLKQRLKFGRVYGDIHEEWG